MPQEIVPIHKQNEMSDTFDYKPTGTSDLQSMLANFLPAKKTEKIAVDENTIRVLEMIHEHENTLITAANCLSAGKKNTEDERYYDIPKDIDDNTVLALKAQGLIAGYGRNIKFTDQGIEVLAKSWLKEENAFDKKRTKSKFTYIKE